MMASVTEITTNRAFYVMYCNHVNQFSLLSFLQSRNIIEESSSRDANLRNANEWAATQNRPDDHSEHFDMSVYLTRNSFGASGECLRMVNIYFAVFLTCLPDVRVSTMRSIVLYDAYFSLWPEPQRFCFMFAMSSFLLRHHYQIFTLRYFHRTLPQLPFLFILQIIQ